MNRDLHISELATCAVRYALGRQTYVSFSVPQAIKSHMNLISTKALYVMSRDIREYKEREGLIGMPCDHRSWMAQNLGFRSCRRRRKTVDLLVAQANPGHSRG